MRIVPILQNSEDEGEFSPTRDLVRSLKVWSVFILSREKRRANDVTVERVSKGLGRERRSGSEGRMNKLKRSGTHHEYPHSEIPPAYQQNHHFG